MYAAKRRILKRIPPYVVVGLYRPTPCAHLRLLFNDAADKGSRTAPYQDLTST